MNNKEKLIHLKALVRGIFFSDNTCDLHKTDEILSIMSIFPSERIWKSLYNYVQFLQRNENGDVYIDLDCRFPGDSLPVPVVSETELDNDMDEYQKEIDELKNNLNQPQKNWTTPVTYFDEFLGEQSVSPDLYTAPAVTTTPVELNEECTKYFNDLANTYIPPTLPKIQPSQFPDLEQGFLFKSSFRM